MSNVRPGTWTTALLLVLVVTACGGASGGSSGDTGIETQDPELVAEGDGLYQANCSSCHGQDLRGTDQGPSHLSNVYEPSHHGDGAFQLAVIRGSPQHHWNFGNMPPITGLSEEDVEAIIAFVRENQRVEGFEPYPP